MQTTFTENQLSSSLKYPVEAGNWISEKKNGYDQQGANTVFLSHSRNTNALCVRRFPRGFDTVSGSNFYATTLDKEVDLDKRNKNVQQRARAPSTHPRKRTGRKDHYVTYTSRVAVGCEIYLTLTSLERCIEGHPSAVHKQEMCERKDKLPRFIFWFMSWR